MSAEPVRIVAPDVGALVEYGVNGMGTGPGKWRVKGWMRVAPEPKLDPDDSFGQILFESCREFDTKNGNGKQKMQWCLREEATHVTLTGLCGCIAPIEKCKVVGRVDWTEQRIDEDRARANQLGNTHEMLF
jgi:hypothetical protein